MAYKLDLLVDCQLHLVFHISSLRKKLGENVVPLPTLPPIDFAGLLHPEPVAILLVSFI